MNKYLLIIILLLTTVSSNSFAGRKGGGGVAKITVPSGKSVVYHMDLEGGGTTYLQCRGSVGDVDYYIFDSSAKLIDSDTQFDSNCNFKIDLNLPERIYIKLYNWSYNPAPITITTN